MRSMSERITLLGAVFFAAAGLTTAVTSFAAAEQAGRCGPKGQVDCTCTQDLNTGQITCTHEFIVV